MQPLHDAQCISQITACLDAGRVGSRECLRSYQMKHQGESRHTIRHPAPLYERGPDNLDGRSATTICDLSGQKPGGGGDVNEDVGAPGKRMAHVAESLIGIKMKRIATTFRDLTYG